MNLKALIEKRNSIVKSMEGIIKLVETEQRAMTDEESTQFDAYKNEVNALDKTIKAANEQRKIEETILEDANGNGNNEPTVEEKEERAFKEFIDAAIEQRAVTGQNLTKGANGAIIPQTIFKRVITKIQEICPIFERCTTFAGKGIIKLPVYGADGSHDISVAYQEEFAEITADIGKFTTIDFDSYLVGALALLSKSLISNSDIDVVEFVIIEMAKKISYFIEKESLPGTRGKSSGALSTTNTMTAAKATSITSDELIDLQAKVPTAYQMDACWTMHPETFAFIKKLKDSNGQYLLNTNAIGEGFPYLLLGKPVYLSDNMPKMAAGAIAVLYGDYAGLGVRTSNGIEMQILVEKYATLHAYGILANFEIDTKVINAQQLATLKMAAS